MNSLTNKDLEDACEYDVSSKMHIDDCTDESLRLKEAVLRNELDSYATTAKILRNPVASGTVIIDDAFDTHVKLLAYAGPLTITAR